MHRHRVESEALRGIGYDRDARILEIEFVSGSVYRYADVPEDLFVALMAAPSHGAFFAERIRDAGFDYMQAE